MDHLGVLTVGVAVVVVVKGALVAAVVRMFSVGLRTSLAVGECGVRSPVSAGTTPTWDSTGRAHGLKDDWARAVDGPMPAIHEALCHTRWHAEQRALLRQQHNVWLRLFPALQACPWRTWASLRSCC